MSFQHLSTWPDRIEGSICILLLSMSCYALDFNRTDPENKQTCLQITRQNIGLKGVMMKFQSEIPQSCKAEIEMF